MKRVLESTCFVVICLMILQSFFSVTIHSGEVSAQTDSDYDGVPDSKEIELAYRHVPNLHFTLGEQFFPTAVNYHIGHSELWLRLDDTSQLIDSNPTVANISLYTSGDYFLNNTLGDTEEIAENYNQVRESIGDIVYSRVTKDSFSENLVVQYWFFYPLNPGSLNQHQGDWEMIQIILNPSETPIYAVYSQHFSGERAYWQDIEKANQTHPRIYVALGSHANYFRSYQGKLGFEGDIVGSSEEISWENLQIIVLGEMNPGTHPSDQNWLQYGGRWGNWAQLADVIRGAVGPTGPGHGENGVKWTDPFSWGANFFHVNQNWLLASWVAYHFIYIFIAILAILSGIKIWRIIKRQRQGKLNLIRILRSKAGIGVALGIVGIVLYFTALFLPWYVVRGTIETTIGLETVGEEDLILLDGVNGLQVNTMQKDQGFAQLIGLAIPLSLILLSSVILNFLDLAGVDRPKAISRTFLVSGITSLIPVILTLGFIIQLTVLISTFTGFMGTTVPPQVEEMAGQISSSPFAGQYSSAIDSYGRLEVWWTLGTGSYMFILAAATKLVAGIITRKLGKDVITENAEELQETADIGKTENIPSTSSK